MVVGKIGLAGVMLSICAHEPGVRSHLGASSAREEEPVFRSNNSQGHQLSELRVTFQGIAQFITAREESTVACLKTVSPN